MAAAPVKSPVSTILYSTEPPPPFSFLWAHFDEMSQDWLCSFNSGITFNLFCAGNSLEQIHTVAKGYWLSPEVKCLLISPASGQEHGLFDEDGARQQDVPTTSNVIGAKREKREKVSLLDTQPQYTVRLSNRNNLNKLYTINHILAQVYF